MWIDFYDQLWIYKCSASLVCDVWSDVRSETTWKCLHGFPSSSKRKKSTWIPPPLCSMMWSVLTCVCVCVSLTRCALCPHFCRRHLQTNMAVRLCDVASLLRSGSWAAEPWTGVCGTSYFKFFIQLIYLHFLLFPLHVIPVMANFLWCSALHLEWSRSTGWRVNGLGSSSCFKN